MKWGWGKDAATFDDLYLALFFDSNITHKDFNAMK